MTFEHDPVRGELKFVQSANMAEQARADEERKAAFLAALTTPGNEAYAKLPEPGGVIEVAPYMYQSAVHQMLQQASGQEVEEL